MNKLMHRLYCCDCKDGLQKLIDEGFKADIIYLDPPFNSNRDYNITMPSGSKESTSQEKAFSDTWHCTSPQIEVISEEFRTFLGGQEGIETSVKHFLKMWISALTEGGTTELRLLSYLCYMTTRLILMKSLLKETGNIFYHCDKSASHYIKIVMDGIFGHKNFINEIIWSYKSGGASPGKFADKHDTILRYGFKDFYHKPMQEKSYTKSKSRQAGWCYYGNNKKQTEFFQDYKGVYNMVNMRDVWDIPKLSTNSKEGPKYPTKKPIALLKRILEASCPDGGVVLDPFCGSGTTIAAAISQSRGLRWVGMDVSHRAIELTRTERLAQLAITEDEEYSLEYISPKALEEYNCLNAYEKQVYRIRLHGGIPTPKKNNDRGVDGTLIIHKCVDDHGRDTWGKVIFSVKSGKQANPAMLRELQGAMLQNKADIGILLLDREPTPNMIKEAKASKKLKYQRNKQAEYKEYDTIQIYSAIQTLEGVQIAAPPSMTQILEGRKDQEVLND